MLVRFFMAWEGERGAGGRGAGVDSSSFTEKVGGRRGRGDGVGSFFVGVLTKRSGNSNLDGGRKEGGWGWARTKNSCSGCKVIRQSYQLLITV